MLVVVVVVGLQNDFGFFQKKYFILFVRSLKVQIGLPAVVVAIAMIVLAVISAVMMMMVVVVVVVVLIDYCEGL